MYLTCGFVIIVAPRFLSTRIVARPLLELLAKPSLKSLSLYYHWTFVGTVVGAPSIAIVRIVAIVTTTTTETFGIIVLF